MRHLLLSLLLLLCPQAGSSSTNLITLAWDVPKEALGTNASVQVYSSTNIVAPLKTWSIVTNIPATTNVIQIQVTPGKAFYAATFSNFWGISDFSNVAGTPPLISGDSLSLTVEKAP